MTITEIIASTLFLFNAPFARDAVEPAPIDDYVVAPGSIEISDGPDTKGGVKAKLVPWEDAVLPLEFADSITPAQKAKVFAACAEWEEISAVRCLEGRYRGRSLRVGTGTAGCWALWGMGNHFVVLRRRMNLSAGCWRHDILVHEIGHALGLIHEHQREDRDDFVRIVSRNVGKGFLALNYKINFNEQDAELNTPYDFGSIMHYDELAFSKNGKATIVAKPGFEQFQKTMGRGRHITVGDADTIAKLYGR